jgi:hypothetical protein
MGKYCGLLAEPFSLSSDPGRESDPVVFVTPFADEKDEKES